MRASLHVSRVAGAFILCASLLAGAARAQIAWNDLRGGPGVDRLQGTAGSDRAFDNFPAGAIPPPHCDHKKDMIDVSGDPKAVPQPPDPNPNDIVVMGPNDYLKCDPDDQIYMVNANGDLLWHGSGSEYYALRNFGLWVRSLIRSAVTSLSISYAEALPLVLTSLGVDPEAPENQWFVEILMWWENEDPDVPPPPPPEE